MPLAPTSRSRFVATLALLLGAAACAPVGGTSTAASVTPVLARDTLAACTAANAGADVSGWREVTGPGFRFCVPSTWQHSRARDTSGTAEGRWRFAEDRSIEWRVGPFAPRAGMPVPYNEIEERDLWLGSRGGRLTITSIQDSHSFSGTIPASGDAPELRLVGSARGAEARAELLTVFRTLEPAR